MRKSSGMRAPRRALSLNAPLRPRSTPKARDLTSVLISLSNKTECEDERLEDAMHDALAFVEKMGDVLVGEGFYTDEEKKVIEEELAEHEDALNELKNANEKVAEAVHNLFDLISLRFNEIDKVLGEIKATRLAKKQKIDEP